MIYNSPAIVFKSVDFKESSKIVTLFTRQHGKIAVIVHGAKKPRNKISGLLDLGNILDVVYYYKSTRSVQILKEASYRERTPNIRSDFKKMAVSTATIELINQLLHDGEVNDELFTFTHNFLVWLNEQKKASQTIFPYVQIRLADIMGIGLQLIQPGTENDQNWYLNIESGSVARSSAASYSYKLTDNQSRYVMLALQARSSALLQMPFEQNELKNLIRYLDDYFKYHLEGIKDRKSDAIFEQIL